MWPLLFTLLLGLTNGHLASVVCMHAPTLVPLSARSACGPVLAFSITSGITVGSVRIPPPLSPPAYAPTQAGERKLLARVTQDFLSCKTNAR